MVSVFDTNVISPKDMENHGCIARFAESNVEMTMVSNVTPNQFNT